MKTMFAWAAAVLVVAGVVGAARAEDGEQRAVAKMVDLNEHALADFAASDFATARQRLLAAIDAGTRGGLSQHKLMARTYVHLAAVFLTGLKDQAKAERALAKALEIRPDIQLTRQVATPELQALLSRLSRARESGARTTPNEPARAERAPAPAADADFPQPRPAAAAADADDADKFASAAGARGEALSCRSPSEAAPGRPVALGCEAAPGFKLARVLLFFRAGGDEGFTAVTATRTSARVFNAVIPAKAVTGGSLQFYVEGRDTTGALAGTVGSPDSPSVLLVRAPGAGEAAAGASDQDSQNGSEGADAASARAARTRDDDPLAGVAEARREEERAARLHRRGAGAFFGALGIGSGYGWHPQSSLEFRRDLEVGAGLGPSGDFQALPEVGYQLREDIAISLQVRLQLIQAQGSGDLSYGAPARGALAVLARGQYFIGDGNAHLVASANVGAGDAFRLVIPPQNGTSLRRHDTVRGGPIVLGPGIGFLYHFNRTIALGAEARALVGAPKLAAVMDLSGGVQIGF